MKFYKINVLGHPTAVLPSVQWNEATQSPLFEFKKDPSGVLAFETDDAELIDLLTSAGYLTEADPIFRPTFPGMGLMHPTPEGQPHPAPPTMIEYGQAMQEAHKRITEKQGGKINE